MREITGLGRPFAVHRNKEGTLFVADFNRHKVLYYNLNLILSGEFEGPLLGPHSIDFDKNGNVYVCDYQDQKIVKFDPAGRRLSVFLDRPKLGSFLLSGPAQAQFSPEGDLIVSDYGSHSLQKFSPEGDFLGWFGMSESGPVKWSKTGTPMSSTKPGGFDRVHSVQFDTFNCMYTADTWNRRVQKFDQNGDFVWEIPFKEPVSLCMNGNQFIVANNRAGQVSCCNLDGEIVWTKGGFAMPYDAKYIGNTLLIADSDNGRVVIEEI